MRKLLQLKKMVEKKKYQYFVNVLKESLRAATITKRILEFEVNLMVDELLVSALAIKK